MGEKTKGQIFKTASKFKKGRHHPKIFTLFSTTDNIFQNVDTPHL
jgi:hypothetical protein